MQAVLHFVIADILFTEFLKCDFESFKAAIMEHKVLTDALLVGQLSEIEGDLQAFFEEKCVDSEGEEGP